MNVPYIRTKIVFEYYEKRLHWLLDFDLITEDLGASTKVQVMMYIKEILSVYIMNNRDFFAVFLAVL